MRRSLLLFVALLLPLWPPTPQTNQPTQSATRPELAQLLHAIDSLMHAQPVDFAAYSALTERSRLRIQELIAGDDLRTAADFLAASKLMSDPSGFYESRRVEHELALTALALGDPAALRRVALTWDGLNWSMGRGQRLGSYTRDGVPNNMDPVPAPRVIRELFKDF